MANLLLHFRYGSSFKNKKILSKLNEFFTIKYANFDSHRIIVFLKLKKKMTVKSNKGVILKAYPKGIPEVDENFELTHRTIDIECLNLEENEFVLRNLYLSIDPYVRVTLHDPALNFMKHGKMISTGQVISGLGVSEVVKTNNPNYKVGDLVYGPIGK
jgi:NADPH-dependent curcumin reductase CurA